MSLQRRETIDDAEVIPTLADVLIHYMDEIPLTDLYLSHPVLRSEDCQPTFPDKIREHIEENRDEITELVNSAVYTVETLFLLGEGETSQMIQEAVKWIELQQLKDGGWHWRPLSEVPDLAGSELWITLAVYDLLVKVAPRGQRILEDARDYIVGTIREGPDDERGWDRLAYVEAARLVSEDPAFDPVERVDAEEYLHEEIDRLRERQLDNGGWVGSEKTSGGGLLQTAMVLDMLTRGELGLGYESVERGLDFMVNRLEELFGARWGGVLIQSLAILADTLLRLGLIQ